ncbi:hypothetical protein EDD86DRAFT_205395, partial [Gorgonomyces haynaldii]
MNSNFIAAFMALWVLLAAGLHLALLSMFGSPSQVLEQQDPRVLNGERPSAAFGWSVLQNITSKPHPYYSQENLRVRSVLIEQISKIVQDYDTWNCTVPNPFTVQLENASVVVDRNALYFYQSNNILVRVNGSMPQSLLLSAHFDSVPESMGATDDGLGIAAMLSTLQGVARFGCQHPVQHSLIFNFNNAEEDGLLGAASFVKHPWFQDVKAVYNFDSRGASGKDRSLLYRTNSFPLVQKVLQSAVRPHASALSGFIFQFIQSDTDFSVYAVGGKPGVDYAFYERAYLYHTELDDIAHASPESLQYASDNMFKSALAVITDPDLLQNVQTETPEIINSPGTLLKPGGYVIGDRFGAIPIIMTQNLYLVSIGVVLVLSLATPFARYFTDGKRTFYTLYDRSKPVLKAYFVIIGTLFVSILLIALQGWTKSLINNGSVYGRPELAVASLFCFVFGIYLWIGYLSKRFSRKPKASSPSTDSLVEGETEALLLETTNPLIYESALFAFWTSMLALSFWSEFSRTPYLYFFLDFSICALVAILVCLILQSCVKKHRDTWEKSKIWKYAVKLHDHGQPYIHLVIAIIPVFLTWDILDLLLAFAPPFTVQGLPDFATDIVLGIFICGMLLPLLPLAREHDMRISGSIALLAWLSIWITLAVLFPFTTERPFKFVLRESLDLDHPSYVGHYILMPAVKSGEYIAQKLQENGLQMSKLIVDSSAGFLVQLSWISTTFPTIAQNTNVTQLMQVNYTLAKAPTETAVSTSVVGPSGCRIFRFAFNRHVTGFKADSPEWQSDVPPSRNTMEAFVFLRSDQNQPQVNVSFQMTKNLTMTIGCEMPMHEQSNYYDIFQAAKPSWMLNGFNSVYDFEIFKTVSLSV